MIKKFIEKNKALSAIFAMTAINIALNINFNIEATKTYKNTSEYIQSTERRKLEIERVEKSNTNSQTNKTNQVSDLTTRTEYIIDDSDKDIIITHLLESIKGYEKIAWEYEKSYIDILKRQSSSISEKDKMELQIIIDTIKVSKDDFIGNNIDQYYINYGNLNKIFNVDITKEKMQNK